MLEYNRIDISEGIDFNKTNLLKECDVCILKILVLSMKSIFAMVVMIYCKKL